MSFETFNFHPSIMAGVRALGYITPTPIQLKSIPPIMGGRDLIGLAQTGTGKTAAFVLPILQRLLQGPRGRVRALIVSPTRELTEQTCGTIYDLGAQTKLQSIAIYGGVSMEQHLEKSPQEFGLPRATWDGPTLVIHLKENFGVKLKVRQAQKWLHRLGYSLKRASYVYLQARAEDSRSFQKNLKKTAQSQAQ